MWREKMKSRKILLVGNWKMNGLVRNIRELTEIEQSLNKESPEICLCLPATLIGRAQNALQKNLINIGAQNCHQSTSGAFTGDVSAQMLSDIGVTHVIVGHSERRVSCGETNKIVKQKVLRVVENAMSVIMCVGETKKQKNAGITIEVIQEQIQEALPDLIQPQNTIIAYEPVWAIGTGKTATMEEITSVHSIIRELLNAKYGESIGNTTRILYGGSVKSENASTIFSLDNVDGALVGGASLKAVDFKKIIQAAE